MYYEFEQAVQILAKALAIVTSLRMLRVLYIAAPSRGQNNGAGDGTGRREARREWGLYKPKQASHLISAAVMVVDSVLSAATPHPIRAFLLALGYTCGAHQSRTHTPQRIRPLTDKVSNSSNHLLIQIFSQDRGNICSKMTIQAVMCGVLSSRLWPRLLSPICSTLWGLPGKWS